MRLSVAIPLPTAHFYVALVSAYFSDQFFSDKFSWLLPFQAGLLNRPFDILQRRWVHSPALLFLALEVSLEEYCFQAYVRCFHRLLTHLFFLPPNIFLPTSSKSFELIAPATDTRSGLAIFPMIGRNPPFCFFLPSKCQIPRLR